MPDIAHILAEQEANKIKPVESPPSAFPEGHVVLPAPPGPKPAAITPAPPGPNLPVKPIEDPPAHPTPPPDFDIDFERSKDRLRRDLETIDKHSPSSRIPPIKYPFFVPYVARTVVQNALDRNMQLKEDSHTAYLREVDEVIMLLYPLLLPALLVLQEAVEKARVVSTTGLRDARPDERTLAFEQAILAEFEQLKGLDFPNTHLTEEGVTGLNICKQLVEECYTKLVRRIDFRRKRNAGLLAVVDLSPRASAELQDDKVTADTPGRELIASADRNSNRGVAV